MYVVLVDSKTFTPLSDLMPELSKEFPNDGFSIHGSEEKGYQLRIDGAGCEKAPRLFSQKFLKKWKPIIDVK